jgi:secreted trypsin-like serine protease
MATITRNTIANPCSPRRCWYSLVTATLIVLQTIQAESHGRDLIVNGVSVDAEFPWFVFSKFGQARGCSGTLIHKDIVLSAAHCYAVFYDRGAYIGGKSEYGLDGMFHEDENVTVHPFFDTETYANDLMLVKLETFSDAPTVTLNFDPAIPEVGNEVVVIGFGDVRENGKLSPDLLQATLTVSGRIACLDYYQQFETPISYAQLCAMDESPDATNATRQDACQSDSGGPVLLPTTNNGGDGWEQVGIVSFSKGCGRENVPGVYTKLSVYQEWIEGGICALSADPPERCAGANSSWGGAFSPSAGQPSFPASSPGSSQSASNPSSYTPGSSSNSGGGSDNGNNGAPTIAPTREIWLTIFPPDRDFVASSSGASNWGVMALRITRMSILSGFLLSWPWCCIA